MTVSKARLFYDDDDSFKGTVYEPAEVEGSLCCRVAHRQAKRLEKLAEKKLQGRADGQKLALNETRTMLS